jgi:hypothetical protein
MIVKVSGDKGSQNWQIAAWRVSCHTLIAVLYVLEAIFFYGRKA